MADKKISQLTTLAQADVAVTADFLPIVDTSATETKKVTPQSVVLGALGATSANVGIGTASPGATLDVVGTARISSTLNVGGSGSGSRLVVRGTGTTSATFSIEAATSGGATRFLVADDGLCRWYGTSNAETMRLDNAGNLGIGTASPGARLDVDGQIVSRGSIGAFVVEPRDGSGASWTIYNPTGNDFRIYGNGSDRLTIDTSGNLGIGTASPSYRLHVERASAGITGYFFTNDGTNNPRLVIYGDSSGTTLQHTYSSGASSLIFAVGGSIGSGSEVGRVDVDKNWTLGAGTLATNATNGFLYVPTCAGTPTGTPTAKTGYAPIVVDTTNNKMYFYSGGQWRDAGP